MQERARTSFCPITLQVSAYLAKELCRQIPAYIFEQIDTLLNSCGGSERGTWGVGGPFGPEAQNLHVTVRNIYFLSASFA